MFIEGTVTLGSNPADTGIVVQGKVSEATSVPSGGWQICSVGRASDGRFGAAPDDTTIQCPETSKKHLKITRDNAETSAVDGGRNGDSVQLLVGRMVNKGSGAVFDGIVGTLGTTGGTLTYEAGGNPGTIPVSVVSSQVLVATVGTPTVSGLTATVSGSIKTAADVTANGATAYVSWGDGSVSTLVMDSTSNSFSGQHTYTAAGTKTVVVGVVKSGYVPASSTKSITATAPVTATATPTASAGAALGAIKETDLDGLLEGLAGGSESVSGVITAIIEGLAGGGTTASKVTTALEQALTTGTMDATSVAKVLLGLGVESAASIIALATTANAAAILEAADTAGAASIIEALTVAMATNIVGEIATVEAAAILETVVPKVAASILSGLALAKRTDLIQQMTVASLTERLQLVTPSALFAVDPLVLFTKLPDVPVEQLVQETAPIPDPSLPAPVGTQLSSTLTRYQISDTGKLVWASLVASPAPIDKILAQFGEQTDDLKVDVEDLSGPPSGAKAFPTGTVVSDYFNVIVGDGLSGSVSQGHITFYVQQAWVESNNLHKWSVFLYSYDESTGQWIALPSKRIKDDGTQIYYSTPVPAFGTFAVGGNVNLPEPRFAVSDLTIPDEAASNSAFTVTAKVKNLTNDTSTYVANLWLDQLVRATKFLAVDPGVTATLTLEALAPAGSYSLRIDRLTGSLSVIQSGPVPVATPTPAPSPTAVATPRPNPAPTVAVPEAEVTATPAPVIVEPPEPSPTAIAELEEPIDEPSRGMPMPLIIGVVLLVVAGIAGVVLLRTRRR